ncbi:MAG: GHMP kinase [Candidatus Hydrogenedentes bacterium]|nr:GHMP kinase [Candidatus Hydrogenedentota bacterium]
MSDKKRLKCVISAVAPIRICDLGGWTDTWFAEQGTVLNIAVYPYAEVQISVFESTEDLVEPEIILNVENFRDRYALPTPLMEYDKHPLLEACVDIMSLPKNISIEVNLHSEVPPGCSTGTSAAVSVALLAGLDLLTPGELAPYELAMLAHRVETEKLGLQCGIQDQLCSAYGGICYIEMYQYPHASVSPLLLSNNVWWELERRLMLVYLGRSHSSSEVHKRVIQKLEQRGADKSVLRVLQRCAQRGKNALYDGDFVEFGRAMIENTEAQMELHPLLVSETAKKVIDLAKEFGAIGWKVNGAGGEGGSLTLLFDEHSTNKRNFLRELSQIGEHPKAIPIYLARMGIRRWITRKIP